MRGEILIIRHVHRYKAVRDGGVAISLVAKSTTGDKVHQLSAVKPASQRNNDTHQLAFNAHVTTSSVQVEDEKKEEYNVPMLMPSPT